MEGNVLEQSKTGKLIKGKEGKGSIRKGKRKEKDKIS